MQEHQCQLCGARLTKTRYQRDTYRLWACRKCHFAEVYPKPSGKELEEYYRNAYTVGNYDTVLACGEIVKVHKFQRLIAILLELIQEPDFSRLSVLDVGCSNGVFLDLIHKKGCRDFLGLDFSREAVQEAAKRIGDAQVRAGTVAEYAATANRKFSLVTLFDVLEHVADVNETMDAVTHVLHNNGYLVLTTPNWRGVYPALMGSRWPYLIPPEHLSFFCPKSLSMLAQKFGYEVLDIQRAVKYVSLAYFTEVARHLAPSLARITSLPAKILPSRARNIPFPLYLGETFSVLRRS